MAVTDSHVVPLKSDWNGIVLGCSVTPLKNSATIVRHLTSHLDTVLRPCSLLRIHSRKEKEDHCLSSQHFQDVRIASFLFLVPLITPSLNCLLVNRGGGTLGHSLRHGRSCASGGDSRLCGGKWTNLRRNVLIMWFWDSEKGNSLKNKTQLKKFKNPCIGEHT